MGTSYGLIEVSGVVAAVNALDAMCKTATVNLVTWERKLGGRLVTIIVEGDISAVVAAVEAAKQLAQQNGYILAASGVISSPSAEIRKMAAKSAQRMVKKENA